MPSGSSISRLAKYSHDTAEGEDEAIIAPATISNCGPALAIMPGIALREQRAHRPASNEIRNGVAIVPARRSSRIDSCRSPATPTVAAITSAAKLASR